MSVTGRMAEFIVETKWADFPALVVERAKKAAVDTVGVTLAGVNEPVGRIVADFARKMGGAPEASIIGLNARAAAPLAALANGAMGHALDFDDSSYLLSGHPSVVVLPAILAQGEKQGASGREVSGGLHHRLRDCDQAGGRDEPRALRRGLAFHLHARHAGRGGRRRPPARVRRRDDAPRARASRPHTRPAFTRTSER